jgi:serine/threonine protein kinase
LRWADEESEKAAKELKRAKKRPNLSVHIDPSLVDTMPFEDLNTQATQPYTDPRRAGHHGSGISEEDAANIICILHPSTPAAHEAVAATIKENPNHILPNADLTAEDDESLFDPAARLEHSSREIALRISSQVKNSEMGFTFGRKPDRCDVLLTKDEDDNNVSKCHFRIYVNKDAVLMLQDVSTNGTIVDDNHLTTKKKKVTDESSRMLQNGTIVSVLDNDMREIKFLVRIPNRGDHADAYKENLARYLSALPGARARLVLAVSEHPFGIQWNGGSKYNVVGLLGKGAFATVYKLATKNDGQVYAAKELDKRRFSKDNIFDMKFDNEIQIMKDLRHPNIVQYEDYYDHGDWVYIIMEIVPGGELSTYMHQQGPMPEAMVQSMTRQILHALAYLHARGITHRDIKPDNILISQMDPLHVKLSDFGLSKCITDQETFLKTFCGTLLYCAPEIYPGYANYDKGEQKKRRRLGDPPPKRYSERVDMWSFGAVLFHVLCNQAPINVLVRHKDDDKALLMLSNIMTKDIDFSPLYALDVSENAIDFISNLLKRSPGLRPSPKACFQHPWIAEVADLFDYMDLDDEMPEYRGQGLATVDEAEEELLTRSEEGAYDQLFAPRGGVSFGYLNAAGERMSKRQRIVSKVNATAQLSNEVAYPTLPQLSTPLSAPMTNAPGERLFGEITSSALRSSGVFAAAPAPPTVPILRHEIERISVNDFGTFDTDEAPPSTRETSEQPLQYPRALELPGHLPSSAPSLLGAEAKIGQLHMASSPEGPHSEVTTPDTGNPMTPGTRELTPSSNQHEKSDAAIFRQEATGDASEEPVFSRYIDVQVPESLAHDTKFVEEFNARQAADKERRARKAKTFSGEERPKQVMEELAKTIDARTGKEVDSENSGTQNSNLKFSRRIDIPPLESLYPTSTTTPDGFTKPLRRFGKLTPVPGSFADVTIYINSRMTSWGRGVNCNVKYEDKNDARIPHYAIQITYHAPGIEARIEGGQPWETAPGIHTIVSTQASNGIWVNDVELRKESSEERCTYYGKIYTGDIITVVRAADPSGPFLKFRVEMNYGDSARTRPEAEKGFQVLTETVHYRREMKRRESMKSSSKETIASNSPSNSA